MLLLMAISFFNDNEMKIYDDNTMEVLNKVVSNIGITNKEISEMCGYSAQSLSVWKHSKKKKLNDRYEVLKLGAELKFLLNNNIKERSR